MLRSGWKCTCGGTRLGTKELSPVESPVFKEKRWVVLPERKIKKGNRDRDRILRCLVYINQKGYGWEVNIFLLYLYFDQWREPWQTQWKTLRKSRTDRVSRHGPTVGANILVSVHVGGCRVGNLKELPRNVLKRRYISKTKTKTWSHPKCKLK